MHFSLSYCWLTALFAIYTIVLTGARKAEDPCASLIVSVSQRDFIRYEPITFLCSYVYSGPASVGSIDWTILKGDLKTFRRVYTYHLNYPNDPDIADGYADRVSGTFGDAGHFLTMNNTSEVEDFPFLRCTVYTNDCTAGRKDTQPIRFASPSFHRLGIMADGTEVYVNPLIRLSKNSLKVTFYAVSDPQSELSVAGIDINGSQACIRVDGVVTPPWNCSISATFTESVEISCTVKYMGVIHETRPLSVVFYENDADANGPDGNSSDCECPERDVTGGTCMPRLEKVLIIMTLCLAVSF